jgi:cytochrome P450
MAKERAAPPRVRTDFGSAHFRDRLYEQYAAYQRDTPVFMNQEGIAYLARYDDCASLISGKTFRRRLSEDRMNPFDGGSATEPNAFDLMVGHWMIFMDPPRHDVIRDVYAPLFTARAVGSFEHRISGIVQRLLRPLQERETADAVALFAAPLPMLVMCDFVGITSGDQAALVDGAERLSMALDSGAPADAQAAIPTSLAIRDFFDDFVRTAARGARNEFVSGLLAAAEAGRITRADIVYGLAGLIWAGYETTKNLLAGGILALSGNPSQLRLLKERPELAATAVEELLRYVSPAQKLSRWTSEPAAFGDFLIPEATLVVALVGAANRDPLVFERPGDLDLRRAPNRHLSFGKGLHACLGATLARMEGRIAFAALAAGFAAIEACGYRWRPTSALRALDYLTIRAR